MSSENPVFVRKVPVPIFKNHRVLGMVRAVKTSLHTEDAPEDSTPGSEPPPSGVNANVGGERVGVRPEDVVWIFGTARTGSTWLTNMMGDMAGGRFWREPLVGQLFGGFYNNTLRPHLERPHFVLSDATKDAWLRGIRHFVLGLLQARFPDGGPVVIGEPNGSSGAPLMMEALPESRMVLLVRDPRDVVASALDRNRKGGGAYEVRARDPRGARQVANNPADRDPDGFVKVQARRYASNVRSASEAYGNHGGPKALLKYEDLRRDTLTAMRRMYAGLGLPFDDERLAGIVNKHDWDSIPADRKGPGKDNRKATPGGWRQDLTPKQARSVERLTGPFLDEYYPGWQDAAPTDRTEDDIGRTGEHH